MAESHEQVQIAVTTCLPPGHGPEDSNIGGAEFRRKVQQCVAAIPDDVRDAISPPPAKGCGSGDLREIPPARLAARADPHGRLAKTPNVPATIAPEQTPSEFGHTN